jgi:plastocyanin
MRIERVAALTALATSLALAAPAAAATSTVDVGDNWFSPKDLTITAGDTVVWEWVGRAEHNIVGKGPESFTIDWRATGSAQRRFTVAGTYSYLCEAHPEMTGSLVVNKPAPSSGGGGSSGGGSTGGGSTTAPTGSPPSGGGETGPTAAPEASAGLGLPGLGAVDAAPPRLARLRAKRGTLRLRASEASRLTVHAVRVGAKRRVRKKTYRLRAGANAVSLRRWLRRGTYRVSLLATDTGGSVSHPYRLRVRLR